MDNLNRDISLPAEVTESNQPQQNPREVVIFLRNYGFFSEVKGQEDEVDIDDFMRYVETDLKAELRLKDNPLILTREKDGSKGHPIDITVETYHGTEEKEVEGQKVRKPIETFSKTFFRAANTMTQHKWGFAAATVVMLEEQGYLKRGSVPYKPESENEIKIIMDSVRAAVTRAVDDYELLDEADDIRQQYPSKLA